MGKKRNVFLLSIVIIIILFVGAYFLIGDQVPLMIGTIESCSAQDNSLVCPVMTPQPLIFLCDETGTTLMDTVSVPDAPDVSGREPKIKTVLKVDIPTWADHAPNAFISDIPDVNCKVDAQLGANQYTFEGVTQVSKGYEYFHIGCRPPTGMQWKMDCVDDVSSSSIPTTVTFYREDTTPIEIGLPPVSEQEPPLEDPVLELGVSAPPQYTASPTNGVTNGLPPSTTEEEFNYLPLVIIIIVVAFIIIGIAYLLKRRKRK